MKLGAAVGRWTANPLRWLFLLVFILSAAFGGALYARPTLASFLWPYDVKPLAARFFASVFLALAVASILAMRDPNRTSSNVLLVMGACVFGAILAAGLVDVFSFTSGLTGSVLWIALLAALVVGSAYFFFRSPAGADGVGFRVPRWLRRHFLLHTAIILFFSVQMVVTPSIARAFWPWTVSDPVMRGIGGLFTGVAMGTAYAYTQRTWNGVRLLLPVNVTFVALVLVAVGLHWSVIAAESPGWHVTIPWLLLYVYTAGYPAYYLFRGPMEARTPQST